MSGRRWVVAVIAVGALAACSAGPEPERPSPQPTPQPTTSSPAVSPEPSPTSPSATQLSGVTLRQLGFENGPLDDFSLPQDLVVTTKVDQPNAVTIIVSRPDPETVERFLRTTLPEEGFEIDARADAGQAMTFEGNGWTGGFTGTGSTSAIILRPA